MAQEVFENSDLLQYLNIKTKSASRGSKSRASFANLYAIYVLVEDYVKRGFHQTGSYSEYQGAQFTTLFYRQRELPFGAKLQNHALNHRLNEEFRKYFPQSEYLPILRDVEAAKYWFSESLLLVETPDGVANISQAVLRIIDAYIDAKRGAFETFIEDVEKLQNLRNNEPEEARQFIYSLLQPNVDAHIFEIVSYAILREFYAGQVIYWGWDLDSIREDSLTLYKTGRTNANDGGIDFVMKPLGRFFQVTETIDMRKYFLDIDKIQKYPLTFVVKTQDTVDNTRSKIEQHARRIYQVNRIVELYMEAIEEIINIPVLLERLDEVIIRNQLTSIIEQIIIHSKLEFNYPIGTR